LYREQSLEECAHYNLFRSARVIRQVLIFYVVVPYEVSSSVCSVWLLIQEHEVVEVSI